MKTQNIFIRFDFGGCVGDGHLFRLKALASQLSKLDFKVIFITRIFQTSDISKLAPYDYILLKPRLIDSPSKDNYAEWLSYSEEEDAAECLELTKLIENKLWIVDHYGIGSAWEEYLKRYQKIIVAIDDLERAHCCDLIIDHNLSANLSSYKKLSLNSNSKFLIGPQFALLSEDILKSKKYQLNNEKKNILLYLGTCSSEIFTKVQNALWKSTELKIDYLSPPNNAKAKSGESILPFQKNVIETYREYKIIIGSCGVSNLERIALGVPSITCGVVDNQKLVSQYLSDNFPQMHLGMINTLDVNNLTNKLVEIFARDESEIVNHIAKLESIVSKDGAMKVAISISKLLH